MIDHVLRFADEAAARAALPQYQTEEGEWILSEMIEPPLTVSAAGNVLPGFWMGIGLTQLSDDLVALPGHALRFARNRTTHAYAYLAPDVNLDLLAVASIEPVFAGSAYTFGDD